MGCMCGSVGNLWGWYLLLVILMQRLLLVGAFHVGGVYARL